MFMVVANNKRVTLYIRSLNAAFDRGNELAALGGRPLVAVSLGPGRGVCVLPGLSAHPSSVHCPVSARLHLLHLRAPFPPSTSAALRRRSQGGACLPS